MKKESWILSLVILSANRAVPPESAAFCNATPFSNLRGVKQGPKIPVTDG